MVKTVGLKEELSLILLNLLMIKDLTCSTSYVSITNSPFMCNHAIAIIRKQKNPYTHMFELI